MLLNVFHSHCASRYCWYLQKTQSTLLSPPILGGRTPIKGLRAEHGSRTGNAAAIGFAGCPHPVAETVAGNASELTHRRGDARAMRNDLARIGLRYGHSG
jgi:hypothetical protein